MSLNNATSYANMSSRQSSIPRRRRTADFNQRRRSMLNEEQQTFVEATQRRRSILSNDRPPECVCGPNIFGHVLGPTVDEPILLGLETFLKMCDECPEKLEEKPPVVEIEEPVEEINNSKSEVLEVREVREESLIPTTSRSSQRAHNGSYEGETTEEEFDRSRQSLGIPEESESEILIPEPEPSKFESESQTIEPIVESTEIQTEEPVVEKSNEKTEPEPSKFKSKSQTIESMVESTEIQTEEPVVEKSNEKTESPHEVKAVVEPQIQSEVVKEETSEVEIKDKALSPIRNSEPYSQKSASLCDKNIASESVCTCSSGSTNEPMDMSCCTCNSLQGNYTNSVKNSCVYDETLSSTCACSVVSKNRRSLAGSSRSKVKSSRLYSSSNKDSSNNNRKSTASSVISKQTSKELVENSCLCSSSVSSTPSADDTEKYSRGDCEVQEIRYAITKITKFCDYTTFEVLKATRKRPKLMPKTLEGVFVLRNKKKNN